MTGTIHKILDNGKPATPRAAPDLLIIHCPRVIQIAPWDAWAEAMLSELRDVWGWTERRQHDAIHIICPCHPATEFS